MKLLAVETATAWQSVAVLNDEKVLARQDHKAAGTQARALLPAIDDLLRGTGLTLADLDGIACSIGPGSFTGIRVGLATCLGLRAGTDLPLALVPTLEALAFNVAPSVLPVCPILTSRKGELYWALFAWVDGRLERMLSERVGSPAALASSLPPQSLVFGDGWTAMESDIRRALPPAVSVMVAPPSVARPSAVSVGRIGLEQLRRGEVAGLHVAPCYVQRAEAELKYEQSGGQSPVVRRQERAARKAAERLARGHRKAGRAGTTRG